MEEVNSWLSDENRLHTGYRLERVDFKEVPVPSLFHQIFERGLNEDDIGELQELYNTLQSRTEVALRDFEKGILVAPSDVGVGISQMVPVVVRRGASTRWVTRDRTARVTRSSCHSGRYWRFINPCRAARSGQAAFRQNSPH